MIWLVSGRDLYVRFDLLGVSAGVLFGGKGVRDYFVMVGGVYLHKNGSHVTYQLGNRQFIRMDWTGVS